MEGVDMKTPSAPYQGRRVLITGHAGFVGSWLSLWLCESGARVTGVDIAPAGRGQRRLLNLKMEELVGDVRDRQRMADILLAARPELVFHLAGQSSVRASYRDPVGTWSTNVMGTISMLD